MDGIKIYAENWKDYELIDAGGGRKLERWGDVITIRPELQAYFMSGKPFTEWYDLAHWEFITEKSGKSFWNKIKKTAPNKWNIKYKHISVQLEISEQKNIGIFPEQQVNWEFILDNVKADQKFLNLFAYTGVASLMARYRGADTYHVDSSKPMLNKAKENMENSSLLNIKWVLEDALKFAEKEVARSKKYDLIIMDPPAWGVGAKKEKWKLEDKLPDLLKMAKALLEPNGILIVNTYSPNFDLIKLSNITAKIFPKVEPELKELWMKTTSEKDLFFGNLMRLINT